MRKPAVVALLVLGAAITLGAGGQPRQAAIEVRLFTFRPDTLDVMQGTRVTWTNADDIEHTVTAGEPEKGDSTFNGSLNAKGVSYSRIFERAGRYPYFCQRHPSMRGEINVLSKGEKP